MGRWITRDPIKEQGGINIYETANNSLLNYYDILGMYPPVILIPPIIQRPKIEPPSLVAHNSCAKDCVNLLKAIDLANTAMKTGNCWKWFREMEADGAIYTVKCHGCLKLMTLATDAWTVPILKNIGFRKKSCEQSPVYIASLLIHEVAHHYSPVLKLPEERDRLPNQAMDACSDALNESDKGPIYSDPRQI